MASLPSKSPPFAAATKQCIAPAGCSPPSTTGHSSFSRPWCLSCVRGRWRPLEGRWRRNHGNPRRGVGAGRRPHLAGAEEGHGAASARRAGLHGGGRGAQCRADGRQAGGRLPGAERRNRHRHLGRVQRLGQPLRPHAEERRRAARRRGERDDGEPHRVSGAADGRQQARRHGGPHQHQSAPTPAEPLHHRHGIQEVHLRRRSAGRHPGGERRSRAARGGGLLRAAGRRQFGGAGAGQLGHRRGGGERRAAADESAGHRRDDLGRDGHVHLHLRHHRPAEGGDSLQPPLPGERPARRHGRPALHAGGPPLHLPAALPRHRADDRRRGGVRNRGVDVRAPAVLGQRLPGRSAAAPVYLLHLRGRAVPLSGQHADAPGRPRLAAGHHDGQRAAAGRLAALQEALRHQAHHRVLRR